MIFLGQTRSPLRFHKYLGTSLGLTIIATFLFASLIGPFALPYDPLDQNLNQALLGISWEHPLGTDWLGRDIFTRIVYGGRITLLIVLGTTLPSSVIGGLFGLVSGYFGGRIDLVTMRIIDILMAFPGLLLALAIVSALGPGLNTMILALAIYLFPRFVRISRGAALNVKNMQYIEAAKALGETHLRIVLLHILPNSITPVITQLTIEMGTVVIMSSGLSFLGLGVQLPNPEWGLMLNDGRQYLQTAPHVPLAPGIAIMLLVLGINLLGDGLSRNLNPITKADIVAL